MKIRFWVLLSLLGLVIVSSSASAVFLTCSDICKCNVACNHPCREYENGPLLTCAITGDCAGGSGCVLAAAEPTIFAPESSAPAVCVEQTAAPAPAE
jgi:hypothetical protein